MPKAINVVPGQRFSRFTVISEGDRKVTPSGFSYRTFWCRCDCGEIRNVRLSKLVRGDTKSCGCWNLEQSRSPERLARLAAWARSAEFQEWVRSPENLARLRSPEFQALLHTPENLARMAARSRSPEARAQAAELGRASATHGLSRHPLYGTWCSMMLRCYDPERDSYKNYGGRGIGVCQKWHDARAYISWVEEHLGSRPGGLTSGGSPEYTIDRIDVNGDYAPGNIRWADWKTQAANKRSRLG